MTLNPETALIVHWVIGLRPQLAERCMKTDPTLTHRLLLKDPKVQALQISATLTALRVKLIWARLFSCPSVCCCFGSVPGATLMLETVG